jgi:hypothetical protein
MLIISRLNPKLLAATHIFGQHDYNRAPLAPPGTRIIAHETPGKRKMWAPHGQDGWYIGPALEHYRCYTVYITKTRSSRVVETVEFSPHHFKVPFPSSRKLATQAAADLTHALLNPQPAGLFCQVGDEQAVALRRLADIFGATKLKCGKEKLTPEDKFENNAPQRVHTTVSPPRVTNKNPEQTSLQHIISPHLTPSSHRMQHTPHRRILTPQKPNGMVRCSSRQQNLSQDMMAETMSQANHCFSISASTKISHSTTPTTESVILPEMENAVICPETIKSLKHQELITKLKYKIQWMRSTANDINCLHNTNTIRFIRRSNIPKG